MNRIKKHRGLRRYYKNLKIKNSNWSGLNFDDPEQAHFDLWHTHFDWSGYGNKSFKKRKPHLDKLFRHFDLLVEKAKSLQTDNQIWATLIDFDSYHDALFLHTPNPKHTNFPWTIKGLSEATTLTNKDLNDYIDDLVGYEKRYGQADEAFCVLFRKNLGISVEQ